MKEKVIVAMSGGVDSSVASALLHKIGYEVIGITLKTWGYMEVGGAPKHESGCCSLDAIFDAKNVAMQFGFPHYTIDFTESFTKIVIENFIEEYSRGRTPNPCVMCNKYIKWDELLRKADELGVKYIATGHYAKLNFDESRKRFKLKKGVDKTKDQSYALWGLTQQHLARTIFPLGDLTKVEVRKLANEFKLKTAHKPESQEICFVADDDYERFLRETYQKRNIQVQSGDLIYHDKKVGAHKGIPFYTVGQRRGVNVALGKPVFVKNILVDDNIIELGDKEEVACKRMFVKDLNFVSISEFNLDDKVYVKIRYSDSATLAKIISTEDSGAIVEFEHPKNAVTPGQSAVFYDENEYVLAGGIIHDNFLGGS